MNGDRPESAQSHTVYEGFSERRMEAGEEKEPSLEEALRDLWDRSGPGEKRLRVIEIEVYGSNPIDMFRVAATD
jgi:hypothetical protein